MIADRTGLSFWTVINPGCYRKYGVSDTTIRKRAKDKGWGKPGNKLTKGSRQEVCSSHCANQSQTPMIEEISTIGDNKNLVAEAQENPSIFKPQLYTTPSNDLKEKLRKKDKVRTNQKRAISQRTAIGTENKTFLTGYLTAFHRVITLAQQQAEIFDINLEDIGLDKIKESDLI